MTAENRIKTEIDDFLQYLQLERGLAENSLSAYQTDLNEFGIKSKVTDCRKISPRDIVAYFSELSRLGRKPATMARKISALKRFFEYLKDKKIIPENPARVYSAPKIVRYHPDYLSPEEIGRIIQIASADFRAQALPKT